MPSIVSVNVGRPRPAAWAGIGSTAMDKRPAEGAVAVRARGLDGDQVGDVKHHGGVEQAVYAFAREDLDWWAERLGGPVRDGMFSENLTTLGIDVNEAEVGERWRIGGPDGVLLEVSSVRIPCNDFKCWVGLEGYDNHSWVKRFADVGRPGPYLRVLEEGVVRAGDDLTVEHRPGLGVTVSTMFRALTTRADLLPRLLEVEGLTPEARERAERYVAAGV